jgi:dipeptidyl-peptidase 4
MRFWRLFGAGIRLAGVVVLALALRAAVTEADYRRAERFLPQNTQMLVFQMKVEPQWIEGGPRFWYLNKTRKGQEFIFVDPSRNIKKRAFDHARIAASHSAVSGRTYAASALPFDSFEFIRGLKAISATVDKKRWICDLSTYQWVRDTTSPLLSKKDLPSPDGRWVAYVKDHNLMIRSLAGNGEIPLTTDGQPHYAYGGRTEGNTTFISDRIRGIEKPPVAVWSPDSKKIVFCRIDERNVQDSFLLQNAPPGGTARPVLHTYKLPLPGDVDLPLVGLFIFDIDGGKTIPVRYERQSVTFETPIEVQCVWWSRDSRTLYYIFTERAEKALRLLKVDAGTGSCREVLREQQGETYVESTLTLGNRPNVRDLPNRDGFIWFSQKDGWGQLYLHDLTTGKLRNRITTGPWVVDEIHSVDETGGWVYLTGMGHEENRDPYYRHLYRSRLDGSRLELLTPEDADHSITFSPDGRFFVDVYSKLDQPPVSLLRSADGNMLRRLETADMSRLEDLGWTYPERFTVKADDGVTDIYGMIIRPTDFDVHKRYPVIDAVYPGPQVIRTPTSLNTWSWSWLWEPQALAELGFIVVTIDGRGTPYRSKAFHDFAYKNFKDGGALQDHVAGLKQLGQTRPYMDLSRVGIYGHSGGGFASTRGVLLYPDFYKVAVSSAGNHDQRGNNAGWGEKYLGLPDGDNYDDQINARLAPNLKGKLLLVHGDMDDNVHPALTLQVVDALIKANKDFDLLILPNSNHSFEPHMSYFIRKKWDYFVRHLLGEEPPKEYRIGAEAAARGPG